MAGNLATKQEYKAGCDFRRFNGEFQQHIVGWGFYINNKNTVASQNSSGSENLTDPKMVLTPLTTLTTAPQGAETLVLSGFQGGGGATRKTRATSAFQGTRSVLLHRETAKGGRSPLLYIRILVNACMSSRNGLRARQTKNFRLAGSLC